MYPRHQIDNPADRQVYAAQHVNYLAECTRHEHLFDRKNQQARRAMILSGRDRNRDSYRESNGDGDWDGKSRKRAPLHRLPSEMHTRLKQMTDEVKGKATASTTAKDQSTF